MTQRIRLAQIVTRLDIGGVPEHLITLVEGLVKQDYEITIVCNHIADSVRQRLENAGVKDIRLTTLHRLPHPGDVKSIWQLYRFLKTEKFDIVHTHMSKAALLGCLTAKAAGVPVIVNTAHNLGCIAFQNPLARALFWLYDMALFAVATDAVILVSDTIRRQIIANRLLPEDKANYVPNGIKISTAKDAIPPDTLKDSIGIAPDSPVIGTVARLVWFKGLHTLIAALPDILKTHPTTRLVIIGDGELKDELAQQAKTLNVSDAVLFLGERQDAVKLLTMFDVFVLPSVSEGMPITILEAMAEGKPVVATNVGGIPELVDDNHTGILVPPEQAQRLAEGITRLLSDDNLRLTMGTAGKERVKTVFSAQNMVDKTINAYNALRQRKGSAA